ncbi:GNAT family N-acetyltransferase [Streptomyces sp. NPDC088789]|uniref:GNAT family N-acetyltransferase n=1 Tax=Streptomyces sp. NPDC088789 TaxID=3365899 RepID=UPI003830A38A
MDETVRAWIDGWVVSRGAAAPTAEPWGWTIDVGLPKEVRRHVLGAVNEGVTEETVRAVAGPVRGPGVWLKAFAPPELVGSWLGPDWWIDPDPSSLMSLRLAAPAPEPAVRRLHPHPPFHPPRPLPEGYRLRTWTRAGVTRVLITGADGSFAARGQVAPTGATAVVDQIETDPAHRRRGLAGTVMRALHRAAAERGARRAVLGATSEGRALYTSLGWQVVAPLTSAKYTGSGAGVRGEGRTEGTAMSVPPPSIRP